MTRIRRGCFSPGLVCVLLLASSTGALAFQVRQEKSRLDELAVPDPSATLDATTLPLSSLPVGDPLRAGWETFRAEHGASWSIYLDRRSGAPMLVEGRGVPWTAGEGARLLGPAPITLARLEASLRSFVAANRSLLLAADDEMVLNEAASGQLTPEVWQVVFDRRIAGVPVLGERYIFTIGHGNLVSFGASRWSRTGERPAPRLDAVQAFDILRGFMDLAPGAPMKVLDAGALFYAPVRATTQAPPAAPYRGPVGAGCSVALVWRIVVRVVGEPGTWVAYVDAHTGEIRAFFDDNKYAQVKGGAYPIANDQICPEGCEQVNYPMPYANLTVGGAPSTASAMGMFECAPGGSTATTTLAGPYVRISDNCGAVSQSVTCDNDLDLLYGPGTDCTVPTGAGAGDTHSSRTGYYHLNRSAEHARYWLPSNTWLQQQLADNVNISSTCNAYWDGAVNFYRSGGGCNNTGENPGVVQHEWGHGMDQNDGGGYDNPSEAYADITEFMSDHTSCIGRGFYQSQQCDGYGNTCLDCTGIRDMDWNQRTNHTPSTAAGFISTNCGGGSGPCGKETHCEGYLAGETVWDLAARDLPAAGFDQATAWQLVDRLWYKSRSGSSGNAYNCAPPTSDGCNATSWFTKLRTIDDDDGNLANGTPHAAAIFAAFDRHNIACGAASDPSNQNSSSCLALAAPTLSGAAGSAAASLSWTAVPNAATYNILRNDIGCSYSYTIIASVAAPGVNYTDTGLANEFTEHYRVQPVGSNSACVGPLSNCQSVTPQPFVGSIAFDRGTYNCSALLTVSVTDGNIGAPTTTATVWSTTEPGPQTVILSQVSPGSAKYTGTIAATPDPPANDGLLSLTHGDAITARYIDADDGQGAHDVPHETAASSDCAAPVISNIQSADVTGNSARITWATDEASTSVVHYGATTPPASTKSDPTRTTGHSVLLTGLAECEDYFYSVESADAVGNSAADDAGGLYYGFSTGKNNQPVYTSTDGPVAIPDNNSTGAVSVINVPDDKTVLDVDVEANITHTYDGDIALHLITPTGVSVTLSNRRGGSGDNFTQTVFDDEATTPVSSGAAPFTGSFRPETPLSAADGINARGDWRFKVVDSAGQDVGTIDVWSLILTFPTGACGPHGKYASHALVQDGCGSGGAGHLNGYWDAGEQVEFSVRVTNDGTVPLTNLTATVTPLTTGVSMSDPSASYSDLAAGASADSLAPHFTAQVAAGLSCGSVLEFQVDIIASEGAWSGMFTQIVGQPLSGNGVALDESFAGGIPASWTVVDGGSGGSAAATWTTSNPGARSITAPLASPVAIVDSDFAGTGASQDEQLITASVDLSTATTVTLDFDQYFYWYSSGQNEVADVDVRSALTGGAWVNVLRQQGASSPNPDHKTLDITAQAAGAPDVQVRFHYYNGAYEWYWQVDNVTVSYTAPGGCDMPVCNGGAPTLRPAPDGMFGSAMTCSRLDAGGSTIQVNWDVATCVSANYHILYGDLASVGSYTVGGAACAVGTTGAYTWSGAPAGGVWFVVVGDDGASWESTWGVDSNGAHRAGATPSGQCGTIARDNAAICP